MTPGIYIQNESGTEYRLLDWRVRCKETERQMCLYCNPYAPQQLYTMSLEEFKKSFTLKIENRPINE